MPLFCYVLYYEIFFFLVIVLLNTWIYYSIFFLKIDLIWWDKFSCNFKYIFINEIGFIKKKIVLIVGKINKKVGFYEMEQGFVGPQGSGMGWESFSRHAGWGGDEDPILRPRPAPLPSLNENIKVIIYFTIKYKLMWVDMVKWVIIFWPDPTWKIPDPNSIIFTGSKNELTHDPTHVFCESTRLDLNHF